ncbi:MAG: response regulator [Calditrichaeota bacterium]|nr:MAG: response regulator [Calditrichota bacterium]MBL1207615.1 response regulator [Calditrichota bacterium]NOG47448.1 response regulator [Calditrichota bacterium]
MSNLEPIIILLADDDEDDCFLIKEAFEESRISNDLQYVNDGEELMDYLLNRGNYEDKAKHPKPDLILLDLNMPRKNGKEALKEIKENQELRKIPVVVLTTSEAEEDIIKTYDLGVNSFITKPVSFDGLVEVVKALGKYWFQIVKLPK